MSRKRLVLLGIPLVAMLLAGSYSIAYSKAAAAQRAPGGVGGNRAEPDVAFIVPNDHGDRGGNDVTIGSSQGRQANPQRPATIDPETGMSIRQRLQQLRELGFSQAFIALFRAMLVG